MCCADAATLEVVDRSFAARCDGRRLHTGVNGLQSGGQIESPVVATAGAEVAVGNCLRHRGHGADTTNQCTIFAFGAALVVGATAHNLTIALRGHASHTAGSNLILDDRFITHPMRPKDAGHAGSTQQKGISLRYIARVFVVVAVSIVVVNKGNCITIG